MTYPHLMVWWRLESYPNNISIDSSCKNNWISNILLDKCRVLVAGYCMNVVNVRSPLMTYAFLQKIISPCNVDRRHSVLRWWAPCVHEHMKDFSVGKIKPEIATSFISCLWSAVDQPRDVDDDHWWSLMMIIDDDHWWCSLMMFIDDVHWWWWWCDRAATERLSSINGLLIACYICGITDL